MNKHIYLLLAVSSLPITLKSNYSNYYDSTYWKYQQQIGIAGGILNKFKFEEFIKPSDTIIDFGCGGGFLLNQFPCTRKIGVEINSSASAHAKSLGIEIYQNATTIDNEVADIIISNHAFEHIPDPYNTLLTLKNKLKPNGIIVIVVPCEQPNKSGFEYKEKDVNQHIFTWVPMTLGNLVKMAGFKIIKAETLRHCWVGDYRAASKSENLEEYHEKCHQQALKTNNYQVRVVAQKE